VHHLNNSTLELLLREREQISNILDTVYTVRHKTVMRDNASSYVSTNSAEWRDETQLKRCVN